MRTDDGAAQRPRGVPPRASLIYAFLLESKKGGGTWSRRWTTRLAQVPLLPRALRRGRSPTPSTRDDPPELRRARGSRGALLDEFLVDADGPRRRGAATLPAGAAARDGPMDVDADDDPDCMAAKIDEMGVASAERAGDAWTGFETTAPPRLAAGLRARAEASARGSPSSTTTRRRRRLGSCRRRSAGAEEEAPQLEAPAGGELPGRGAARAASSGTARHKVTSPRSFAIREPGTLHHR